MDTEYTLTAEDELAVFEATLSARAVELDNTFRFLKLIQSRMDVAHSELVSPEFAALFAATREQSSTLSDLFAACAESLGSMHERILAQHSTVFCKNPIA